MTISVIIPTYNESRLIKDCLLSLSRQTRIPDEIIVVDDGSQDHTVNVVRQLSAKIKHLCCLKQKHTGAGSARNFAASKAKGEILVFVDADMEFSRSFLKQLTKPILSGQSRGTFSREEYVANWHNPWAKNWNACIGIKGRRLIPPDFPDHSPVFRAILKSEFDRVSGFDPKRGYDDDWSLSEKLGYQATAVKDAIYYHHNPDSFEQVFRQSRWRAKRRYKFGSLGKIKALLTSGFGLWIWRGVIMLIKGSPHYLLTHIAFHNGLQVGIIESLTTSRTSK